MCRQWLLLLGAVALPAAGARAQSPELTRIDSLLDRSRFTEARSALERWSVATGRARGPDDVAYALLLRGRMAGNADSAFTAYLELALGHPSSRYAPEALLRLGQGYAGRGQHDRAAGYLERVSRDYPGFPGRFITVAWLARALRATGQPGAACAAVSRALGEPRVDSASRPLLRAELARCEATPPPPNRPSPAPPPGRRPTVNVLPAPPEEAEGRYTVQIAAFRKRDDAIALARRLRAQNVPARVVILAGGSLSLVRAGRFQSSAAAAQLLRRVQTLVPAAHVAADAHREGAASR